VNAHARLCVCVAEAQCDARQVSNMSIDLCRAFPEVATLNLGGGYKVGRMSYEKVRRRSCNSFSAQKR
jgi:hypothetical protein